MKKLESKKGYKKWRIRELKRLNIILDQYYEEIQIEKQEFKIICILEKIKELIKQIKELK